MLQMMEKYANNLEELVEEKTKQHMEEKKKADILLYSMMPMSVFHAFTLYFNESQWRTYHLAGPRLHSFHGLLKRSAQVQYNYNTITIK